jgi:hypothetical protein
MLSVLARAAVASFLVLALSSCASVSVEDGTERVTQKMPEVFYVVDFSTEGGDFKVDRTGRELVEFKKNLQQMLKAAMVADLSDKLVIAMPARKADSSLKKRAWIVRGEIKTVYQGSRFLRGAIGFGAGGTKVETHVEVYDLASDSATPFLTFSTTGGSGAEPGAVLALTTDPVQIAIGGVGGVAHGLSEDTARTAREITAELSDYMHNRGWISDAQWIKPKHENATDTW